MSLIGKFDFGPYSSGLRSTADISMKVKTALLNGIFRITFPRNPYDHRKLNVSAILPTLQAFQITAAEGL